MNSLLGSGDAQLASAGLSTLAILNETQNPARESHSAESASSVQVDPLEQLSAITELTIKLATASSVKEGCESLVRCLRNYFACTNVFATWVDPTTHQCETFVSALPLNRQDEELSRLTIAALQETALRQATTIWPAVDQANSYALRAHQQFAEHLGAKHVSSFPLFDQQHRLRLVILLTLDQNQSPALLKSFFNASAVVWTAALQIIERSEPTRWTRWLDGLSKLRRDLSQRMVLLGIGLTLVVGALPIRYRVNCQCTLEPATKRYIAAPFDAALERSFVKAGDVVEQDQPLANLDGRETALQLEQAQAELHQAIKERAGHLASHDQGKATMGQEDIRRLDAKVRLLAERSERSTLRSPLTGIVVSGDLSGSDGVPLKQGQVVFEIASLDEMMIEIQIPEIDITYVEKGMPLEMRLDAFPFRTYRTTLENVQPRSELIDRRNVFVAKVSLENGIDQLRPGMKGRATIYGHRLPLAWTLLRRPLESIISTLGW